MRKAFVLVLVMTFLVVPIVLFAGGQREVAQPTKDVVVVSGAGFLAMTQLDPVTSYGMESISLIHMLFDGIVMKNADGEIVPALAKDWEISGDGLRVDFYLDPQAKWHDGTPVTAADFAYSMERYTEEGVRYEYGFELANHLNRVEVVAPDHARFHLNFPYGAFFDRLTERMHVMPKHYREAVGDEEFARNPLGSGPFRLVDFEVDTWYELEAVKDHYRNPPEIDRITLRYVAEAGTRMAMLETGEADIIAGAPVTTRQAEADPDLSVVWSRDFRLPQLVTLDTRWPDEYSPLHDRRVRDAISHAIDREGIARQVFLGTMEAYGDWFPPYSWGHNPDKTPAEYNPARARQLLAEAGYPDGFAITLHGTIAPEVEQLKNQAIAANLEAIGLTVRLDLGESVIKNTAYNERRMRGLWTGGGSGIAARGWTNPAAFWVPYHGDPKDYIWAHSTTPEIESAIRRLSATLDPESGAQVAAELGRALDDGSDRIPLWSTSLPYILGPRVEYWEPVPGTAEFTLLDEIRLRD